MNNHFSRRGLSYAAHAAIALRLVLMLEKVECRPQ
jgi:hypothetical protein